MQTIMEEDEDVFTVQTFERNIASVRELEAKLGEIQELLLICVVAVKC